MMMLTMTVYDIVQVLASMRIRVMGGAKRFALSKWSPPKMAIARMLSYRCARPCFAIRQLYSTPLRSVEVAAILPWRRKVLKEENEMIGGVASVDEVPRRKEKFIPVTRRSLMRQLREEDGLLNWEEREKLEIFASSLDAHFSQRFLGTLAEAKVYTNDYIMY